MLHIKIKAMEHINDTASVDTACAITQIKHSPPTGLLIFEIRTDPTICNAVTKIIPLKTMRNMVKRLANKSIYVIFFVKVYSFYLFPYEIDLFQAGCCY